MECCQESSSKIKIESKLKELNLELDIQSVSNSYNTKFYNTDTISNIKSLNEVKQQKLEESQREEIE